MKIEIDGYTIRDLGDGLNVILEKDVVIKRGDNAGRQRTKTIGYFPNVALAIRRLANESLSFGSCESIEGLSHKIEQLDDGITSLAQAGLI